MTTFLSVLAALALVPYAIGGLVIVAIALLFLALAINAGYRKYKEWKSTGFCRHEFELERTNSYGAKAWYKCKHCDTERLR